MTINPVIAYYIFRIFENNNWKMARELKATVSFMKQPGDDAIYFKVDGGRFDETRTIKLNSNCKYKMNLTFRPAILIE